MITKRMDYFVRTFIFWRQLWPDPTLQLQMKDDMHKQKWTNIKAVMVMDEEHLIDHLLIHNSLDEHFKHVIIVSVVIWIFELKLRKEDSKHYSRMLWRRLRARFPGRTDERLESRRVTLAYADHFGVKPRPEP